MLAKIKQYWTEFRLAIVAGIIALAYFIGIRKGKNNEKASQNKKVLANMARANKARTGLANSATTRKLHDKYKR